MNRVNSGCENERLDTGDWGKWLQSHLPALLLYARQQTRSEADALDVVQDATLECWNRSRKNQAPALPHVFATIRRRAIDLARSTSRRVSRETAVCADSNQPWFDQTPESRERALLLQKAMTALPDIYREVVTLKVWGELTFEEIAIAVGIPANTAASRFRYGLEQLRENLKEILT